MKINIIILSLLLSVISIQIKAQSTIFPNITFTDQDGISRDLYQELDSGKTVIVNTFATWANAAINSLPYLDTIWEVHGPAGDNSIMIYSLEVDGLTTNEAEFISTYNLTNPVFGQAHDIWDTLPNAYLSFPQYWVVCPDRTWAIYVQAIYDTTTLMSLITCNSLAFTDNANFVELQLIDYDCDSAWFDVGVQNYGTDTIKNFDLEIRESGVLLETINWTGNMQSYGLDYLSLNSIGGDLSNLNLDIQIVNVNAGTDGDPSNNDFSGNITVVGETQNEVAVSILHDRFSEDISWEILDGLGNLISSKQYDADDELEFMIDTIVLPGGVDCYTFNLYDSYGDGMGFINSNYVEVFNPLTSQSLIYISGGSFTSFAKGHFTATSTTDIDESQKGYSYFDIFPNPAGVEVQLSVDMIQGGAFELNIIDMNGRIVRSDEVQFNAGINSMKISLVGIPVGVYLIQFSNDEIFAQKRLIINK